MLGHAIEGDLCYREAFSPKTKERFSKIIKKLFNAPLWVIEQNQKQIAGANKDSIIKELFNQEHFDYIYLTNLSSSH